MGDESFDPPSDFEPEGNVGGEGRSIWVWIGVGCFGLLLIGGVALAFGAYKTVSCCREVAQQQRQVLNTGLSFARDVASTRYERAWSNVSERYQDETTFEEFRAQFEEHRDMLGEARVHLQRVNVVSREQDAPNRYQVAFGLTHPDISSDKIALSLEVVSAPSRSSSVETQSHRVDSLSIERRERVFANEPAGQVVQQFHSTLAENKTSRAYRQWMSNSYRNEQNSSAFKTFVDEHAWLKRGNIDIRNATYARGTNTATVRVHYTFESSDGSSAPRAVTYRLDKLDPGAWKIRAITPDASPSDSSGTSGATSSSDTGPSDDDTSSRGIDGGSSGDAS